MDTIKESSQKKQSIYTKLGAKYNIPSNIVKAICSHPFMFARKIMAEEDDIKPIMFAYLFKIKLKNKFERINSKTLKIN